MSKTKLKNYRVWVGHGSRYVTPGRVYRVQPEKGTHWCDIPKDDTGEKNSGCSFVTIEQYLKARALIPTSLLPDLTFQTESARKLFNKHFAPKRTKSK